MSDIYNQLVTVINRGDKKTERQLVAAYFVSDYYTLSNKEEGEIGGIDYFYADKKMISQSMPKKNITNMINNMLLFQKLYDMIYYPTKLLLKHYLD